MRTWLLFGAVVSVFPGLAVAHGNGPAATAPRVVYFGVNLHPLQDRYAIYSPVKTLQLAGELGASVVRIDIPWNWFDYTQPGTAPWYAPLVRELDAFLAEAARRHIRVVATILGTPCWASSQPRSLCPAGASPRAVSLPPANPEDYADFLRRLIRHVGQKIEYFEIWNEPNLPHSWANADAAAYTRLLRAAYRAIKEVDPAAQVLAGATSGADTEFVERMYEAGAKGYFDALSIHPYSGSQAPDICSTARKSFGCGVEQIRQVMLRHGDRRPIWLTEFGTEISDKVDPKAQASYVTKALAMARRWGYVRGVIWYELYDDPTGHDGQHYGLFEGSLCPRPAALAFQTSVPGATTSGLGALPCRQNAWWSVARMLSEGLHKPPIA